jgi:hypothetical protein
MIYIKSKSESKFTKKKKRNISFISPIFIIIYTYAAKYPNCPPYFVLLFLEEQINSSLSLYERKENVWGVRDGMYISKQGSKKRNLTCSIINPIKPVKRIYFTS